MKDLKAFMNKVKEDKKLEKKVNEAANVDEIVAIAADAGYTFTTNDLMDERMGTVSGGTLGTAITTGDIQARANAKINAKLLDFSHKTGNINVNATGDNSTAMNEGGVTIGE